MNKHRVVYLRDSKRNPIGCIATQLHQDENANFSVSYQYSVVNPKDQFKRDVARNVASIRLDKKPYSVALPSKPSNHEVLREIMKALFADSHTPSRARKAARLWLNHSKEMEVYMAGGKDA